MRTEEAYYVIATIPMECCHVFKYGLDDYETQEERESQLELAKIQYNRCLEDKQYSYVQFVHGVVHAESKRMSTIKDEVLKNELDVIEDGMEIEIQQENLKVREE